MIRFTGHKTIKVEQLKIFINTMLANEKISKDEKIGYCILIEKVLLNTNNYKGFNNIKNAKHNYERIYY